MKFEGKYVQSEYNKDQNEIELLFLESWEKKTKKTGEGANSSRLCVCAK